MLGKMDGSKVQCDVRKSKKKQGKDEMDRIKQIEKKRRRLEKALATSAAIRCELEKKKQKKKEEQQRLDEEGAAIAEAVALHVLLGEEDSDDSCNVILNENDERGLNRWDNLGSISRYWLGGGIGRVSDPHLEWRTVGTEFRQRYIDEECWHDAGLIAAQAVSSLHIGEDPDLDKYVFNPMSRC